jgi:hypothetical protein
MDMETFFTIIKTMDFNFEKNAPKQDSDLESISSSNGLLPYYTSCPENGRAEVHEMDTAVPENGPPGGPVNGREVDPLLSRSTISSYQLRERVKKQPLSLEKTKTIKNNSADDQSKENNSSTQIYTPDGKTTSLYWKVFDIFTKEKLDNGFTGTFEEFTEEYFASREKTEPAGTENNQSTNDITQQRQLGGNKKPEQAPAPADIKKSVDKQVKNIASTQKKNSKHNSTNVKTTSTQQLVGYGSFKNVMMTEREYNFFTMIYGLDQTQRSVERMSKHIQVSGKTYKDIAARFETWIQKDADDDKAQEKIEHERDGVPFRHREQPISTDEELKQSAARIVRYSKTESEAEILAELRSKNALKIKEWDIIQEAHFQLGVWRSLIQS